MRKLIEKNGIDRIKYINKETNEVIGYVDYEGHLPEGPNFTPPNLVQIHRIERGDY